MGFCTAWGLAAAMVCTAASAWGAAPASGATADLPQAAHASRTPDKRPEKQPVPRKSKKPARSGGAASAAS